MMDKDWENPRGVPIDAILFGGRRPEGIASTHKDVTFVFALHFDSSSVVSTIVQQLFWKIIIHFIVHAFCVQIYSTASRAHCVEVCSNLPFLHHCHENLTWCHFLPTVQIINAGSLGAVALSRRLTSLTHVPGVPLVYEALNWRHGVFVGASMRSEATAAAEHKG